MSKARASGRRKISMVPKATALTIAGSDPSGGAGLQADLKTFQQAGVFGTSAVTLITVQNTQGVTRVEMLSPQLVREQIRAVLSDIPPRAIKVGALGTSEMVRVVAEELKACTCPIVVDPVLVSKHGHSLADDDAVQTFRTSLLPLATVVTPNRLEAERLTGIVLNSNEACRRAIEALRTAGVRYPLIKAGLVDDVARHWLGLPHVDKQIDGAWLDKTGVHGSGCVLAAAMTAAFALGCRDVSAITAYAIEETFSAIAINTRLGLGIHPVDVRVMRRDPFEFLPGDGSGSP